MTRLIYLLVASALITSLALAACAKPAPSPLPPTTPTTAPTGVSTPSPKASPTPAVVPAQTPSYGGVFRWTRRTTPRGFYPPTMATASAQLEPAYDTLLVLDSKGELAPMLATDWQFSPDFRSFTLTLRKGVKFHDGTRFDAAAVKWNMELRKANKFGDLDTVTSIDVVDDYTVRFNISKFTNTFTLPFWGLAGYMASPTAWEKNGKDWAQTNAVGTGPFKFVSFEVDTVAKYVRSDGYWQKGKPYLESYEARWIANDQTRSLSFQKGEIDGIDQMDAKESNDLMQLGHKNLRSSGTLGSLFPDSANPDSPLANKKVREAMEYALDRVNVSRALGYGMFDPLNQLAFGSYAYVPDLKGRPYDPARAKQLLSEAGYPNGFKTTIYMRTGTPLTDAIIAWATNLKEVGIDATVSPITTGRFTQLNQEGWKNGLMAQIPSEGTDWLDSVYKNVSATITVNISTQRPPGLQDLLEQALSAPDTARRKSASQQVVRKISDEAMVIPLVVYRQGAFVRKGVQGIGWIGTNDGTTGPADVWISK
ncbi:MAG: ABC transporter substrate-binding protein [Chloroflexi bacterium]|nr:ABC transporter substrate-binding protein [Chloroflexota bacterium]